MEFEIRIERPIVLLALVAGFIGAMIWLLQPTTDAHAMGGSGETTDQTQRQDVTDTEGQIQDLREQQAVLQNREQILRSQLEELQREADENGGADPALAQQIADASQRLNSLLLDQRSAEGELLSSLRELWQAEGEASYVSDKEGQTPYALAWPVPPLLGISAGFHDASYRKEFGMEHNAIDIPVDQGSDVLAAADGVVAKVSDKGMGFNSLVIDHGGGMSTLYGHVTKFLVQEGQTVHAGQVVAKSGGRPGTPGAGMFTTGPHLHFEVHVKGQPVDPMGYLPPLAN